MRSEEEEVHDDPMIPRTLASYPSRPASHFWNVFLLDVQSRRCT